MPPLPVELYRTVIEAAGRQELFNLVTVCKLFQHEAERVLWHEMIFDTKRSASRLDDIIKVPRIWPLIKILRVKERLNVPGWSADFSYALLGMMLQKLSYLVALELPVRWHSCVRLFDGCTFQLQILHCSFKIDNHFISFLESQKSITEWFWTPLIPSPTRLPSSVLPGLAVFVPGNPKHVDWDHVVKGRPITHCRLLVEQGFERLLWNLRLSTGTLRVLKLPLQTSGPLALISEFFPKLEILSNLDFEQMDESEVLSDFIPRFTVLHTLTISEPQVLENDDWDPMLGYPLLSLKLHTACPSLRRVFCHEIGKTSLHTWDSLDTHRFEYGVHNLEWEDILLETRPLASPYRFHQHGTKSWSEASL